MFAEKGRIYIYANITDNTSLMIAKGKMLNVEAFAEMKDKITDTVELEEKEEYLVVLSLEDLSKELQKKIRLSWGTKESQLAIEEYILSHPACLLP